MFEKGSLSRRVFLYATAGAFIGTAWGAWALASRGADSTAITTSSAAPSAPNCPAGYARATGFDSTAIVEGTRNTRWLVRCDPVRSESAVSESLELFWSPELIADPRARPEVLRSFVSTIAQANRVALEPVPQPERRPLAQPGATPTPPTPPATTALDGLVLDVRGGFRLPSFVARAWAFPAGSRTLLALLVAPSARAQELEAAAADAVARVQGLRAYDAAAPSERGFAVTVACPARWTDATPQAGGPAPAFYVGRYCIEPTQGGGAELTFAEINARMEGDGGADRLFSLASSMIAAVGTRVTSAATTSADAASSAMAEGFARSEPVTVSGVAGRTARAEIEPPAARLAMRAWMAPAGSGSVFALSTSLADRADPVRAELDRWLTNATLARPYDPRAIEQRRSQRFRGNIVAPGVITAVLGVLLAIVRSRSLAREKQ
ncbi:MAG: hypothetical protein JNK05_01535 [Myxococcales bacterium]|nr:hypothetical protein [Myxococcales bacterium]